MKLACEPHSLVWSLYVDTNLENNIGTMTMQYSLEPLLENGYDEVGMKEDIFFLLGPLSRIQTKISSKSS
jgi:hypothetical protein